MTTSNLSFGSVDTDWQRYGKNLAKAKKTKLFVQNGEQKMLNLLKNTKPWMVASFLVATSVCFGQECPAPKTNSAPKSEQPCPKPCPKPDCKPKACPPPCPQPCPPTQMCPPAPSTCCPPWPVPVLNAAYNYPARIQTRCPWDISFDASFIYWQPLEDNLELGVVNNITTSPIGTAATGTTVGYVVDMDFKYKPGFKVGFGVAFDYDNWDTHAEYTWFHNTNSNSVSVPGIASPTQDILPMWGSPTTEYTGGFAYHSASAKWKLHMDIVDLDLGRWYYVGTKLTFRPNFGARAAFIRQNYNITYLAETPFDPVGQTGAAQTAFRESNVFAKSHSWGLGFKTGLDTNWMIGQGFRVFGCGEADILFTRYTQLSTGEDSITLPPTTPAALASITIKQRNHNTVRTHLDIQMGIGWGTYWDCNNWYTDVMLGYEFQVFFDQNMFRHYNNGTMTANSMMPNGDLFTQGLTAQFMLTF